MAMGHTYSLSHLASHISTGFVRIPAEGHHFLNIWSWIRLEAMSHLVDEFVFSGRLVFGWRCPC